MTIRTDVVINDTYIIFYKFVFYPKRKKGFRNAYSVLVGEMVVLRIRIPFYTHSCREGCEDSCERDLVGKRMVGGVLARDKVINWRDGTVEGVGVEEHSDFRLGAVRL